MASRLVRLSQASFFALVDGFEMRRRKRAKKIRVEEDNTSRKTKLPRKRILLTDGRGIAARQLLFVLHMKGHNVHVICSNPPDTYNIGDFASIAKAKIHFVDGFSASPEKWLQDVLKVAKDHNIDIVIPVNDEIYAISASIESFLEQGIHLAVPQMRQLRQVANKASICRTLRLLKAPKYAPFQIAGSKNQLERFYQDRREPAVIKKPSSASGGGIKHAIAVDDHENFLLEFPVDEPWDDDSKRPVIQRCCDDGDIVRVMGVFQNGDLKRWHAWFQKDTLPKTSNPEHRMRYGMRCPRKTFTSDFRYRNILASVSSKLPPLLCRCGYCRVFWMSPAWANAPQTLGCLKMAVKGTY